MQAEQRFSTENMPPEFDEQAKTWRKTALTKAMRISGPFVVETSEGPLRCEDGYLAVDARGYPYPIATDEFVKIYAPTTNLTSNEDIDNRFTFHPVRDDDQRVTYENIREAARLYALDLVAVCPHSRELSLALTKLEETVFWANAAVARHDEEGERI